jgi:hypothetical protein
VRWVQSTARMAPLGTVGDQPQLSRQSAEVTPTPAAYRCRGAAQPFTSGCTPGHSGSSSLALPGLPHTQPYARRLHQAGPPGLAVAGLSCPLGEFPLASVGQVEFIEKDLTASELVCAPVASSGTGWRRHSWVRT